MYNPLLNLPIENITTILSYLTLFELIPLSQICKYFHSIILPFGDESDPNNDEDQNDYAVWRNVAYCHYGKPYVDLGRKKKRVERVSNVNLQSNLVSIEKIKNIIEKTAKYWHSLVIDFDGNNTMMTDFMYLLHYKREHKVRFTNLKSIKVNYMDTASSSVLSKILALCPSIEELICNQTYVLELELDDIKTKCFKNLKRLTINSSEHMLCSPEKGLFTPSDLCFEKLEEIHISGFSHDLPRRLEKTRSSLFEGTSLKKVVIERCNLNEWITSFTPENIEYLEIRECVGLDSSFMELILKMKNLKTLILDIVRKRKQSSDVKYNPEKITDSNLVELLKEAQQLEFLDLRADLSEVKGDFLQSLRNNYNLIYLALESTETTHIVDHLQEISSTLPYRNSSVQYLFLHGDPKFSEVELCKDVILPYFSENLSNYHFTEVNSDNVRPDFLTLTDREFIFYDNDGKY